MSPEETLNAVQMGGSRRPERLFPDRREYRIYTPPILGRTLPGHEAGLCHAVDQSGAVRAGEDVGLGRVGQNPKTQLLSTSVMPSMVTSVS